jgi:hypothetical protein
MYRRTIFAALFVFALAAPLFATETAPVARAGAECTDAEVKAEVPALSDFHEVIMPLWHDAWPNRNFAEMRELMPKIRGHLAALKKVELPGILREKQAKWDAGLAGVGASVDKLEAALAAKEDQAALDAAEALHAGFEGLVRTVRPRMAELDAFHQVLYRVYHYDWPNKDHAALAKRADELTTACATLQKAAVPKRFAAKEAQLREAFGALAAATAEFRAAAAGAAGKALDKAVETMHAKYQACEALFE